MDKIDKSRLFIKKKHLPEVDDNILSFTVHNGVVKRVSNSPLAKRMTGQDNVWYRLSDLPENIQDMVIDMAVSIEDMAQMTYNKKSQRKYAIYDNDNVKIYLQKSTELLPIVGNLLPSDGTNAYTVVKTKDGLDLRQILICWNCHWADLFTGNTKYGENVFCLASDLNDEQRIRFADDIITLEDVPEFLGEEFNSSPKKL